MRTKLVCMANYNSWLYNLEFQKLILMLTLSEFSTWHSTLKQPAWSADSNCVIIIKIIIRQINWLSLLKHRKVTSGNTPHKVVCLIKKHHQTGEVHLFSNYRFSNKKPCLCPRLYCTFNSYRYFTCMLETQQSGLPYNRDPKLGTWDMCCVGRQL